MRNGKLLIDRVSCEELAKQYGTPLYVLSEKRIRKNYRTFHEALNRDYHNTLVCPALKANAHLAVCRIYQREGAGAEVVSSAELRTALQAEIQPERIVYNGPVKREADLELAIASTLGLINADSVSELDHMQEISRRLNQKCNTGIRVNIGIKPQTHRHLATAEREHKFGIWIEDAIDAYRHATKKPDLNIIGLHCHIGSNINEPGVIAEMSRKTVKLATLLRKQVGLRLTKIDFGGGMGFSYQSDSRQMTYDQYASAILSDRHSLRELDEPQLIFEPGRAVVADAGVLLTSVVVLKRQGNVNWALVDAGMNTFIRPALYGAKHQVILANRSADNRLRYDVGGPCCESADVIADGAPLPVLREGDLLAVLDVGAYGFSMSNNYNGQPRAAVVLVNDGEGQLIRKRETYEDMIASEIVPSQLR
jgi:diaminopimelate decarboxylase